MRHILIMNCVLCYVKLRVLTEDSTVSQLNTWFVLSISTFHEFSFCLLNKSSRTYYELWARIAQAV